METQNNNQNKDEINKEETNQITTQKLAPTSTPTIIETSINTTNTGNTANTGNTDSITNNKNEVQGTTLLLNNNTKTTNKGLYKMIVYLVLAIIFGYFITKTDNNKYKIGLITGFVVFSTFLFNKYFKEPTESHTVSEDNGSNLIEG